jgi:putative flippase GtrA
LRDPRSGRPSSASMAGRSPVVGEVARVARFGLVGVVSTAVYFLLSVAMVELASLRPMGASVIGQIGAGIVSYLGHVIYSFRVRRDHRRHGWRFVVIAAATFGLNVLLIWLLTEVAQLPYWIAFASLVVMIPTINYIGNRFWVFRGAIDGRSI